MYKEVCLCALTTRKRVIIFKIKWLTAFVLSGSWYWLHREEGDDDADQHCWNSFCTLLPINCSTLYTYDFQHSLSTEKNNCKDFKDNRILRINIYIVILSKCTLHFHFPKCVYPPPFFILGKHDVISFFPSFVVACSLIPFSLKWRAASIIQSKI